jgi:hypothetical protein
MVPSREPSTERRRENNESAATVRIPEYYADAPMNWFHSINTTFAISRITKPITKFHWALSKLPATLVDTIGPLSPNAMKRNSHRPKGVLFGDGDLLVSFDQISFGKNVATRHAVNEGLHVGKGVPVGYGDCVQVAVVAAGTP